MEILCTWGTILLENKVWESSFFLFFLKHSYHLLVLMFTSWKLNLVQHFTSQKRLRLSSTYIVIEQSGTDTEGDYLQWSEYLGNDEVSVVRF